MRLIITKTIRFRLSKDMLMQAKLSNNQIRYAGSSQGKPKNFCGLHYSSSKRKATQLPLTIQNGINNSLPALTCLGRSACRL